MDPYLQEMLNVAEPNRSPPSATAIKDTHSPASRSNPLYSMSIYPHIILDPGKAPPPALTAAYPAPTSHHTVQEPLDLPYSSSVTDSTVTGDHDRTGCIANHEADIWDGEDELDDDEDLLELSPGSQASTAAQSAGSPKKKSRLVLPRGKACLACRGRKLKCSGETPCLTCFKGDIKCIYQEVKRRKPRKVLLEERIVELETILRSRGEDLPPTKLGARPGSKVTRTTPTAVFPTPTRKTTRRASAATPIAPLPSSATSAQRSKPMSRSLILPPPISTISEPTLIPRRHSEQLPSTLPTYPSFPVGGYTSPGSITDIQPHSVLEANLIRLVLPYTPHLSIPVHPQRFLALLTLSTTDPSRPHPSLLYILFAEAVRILEADTPPPLPPLPPPGSFRTTFTPPMPDALSPADKAWLSSQVRGSSNNLLERARSELDRGIRTVDRPFDLTRAAIGIARYLYSLGRFIEGWNVPVMRLATSCGLHRMSGNIVQPDPPDAAGNHPPMEYMPRSYASTTYYLNHHAYHALPSSVPPLRMRQLIIPPPRDEIDLSERVMTFWAAKCNDYAGGVGWGWSLGLSDDECTTEWPWGSGVAEIRSPIQSSGQYRIDDLFDPDSPIYMSTSTESTYVLSVKSQCLVNRASHLNDLPESSIPHIQPDGRLLASHIPPLAAVQEVEAALKAFRAHLPPEYVFPPTSDHLSSSYDPFSDPWYILLHTALFTAEMLTFREKAVHDGSAYHRGIGAARGLVQLVQWVKKEQWVHVDMMVAINLSLAARLLHKEADRLRSINQNRAANMAADEAETLRLALAGEFARWMPMAGLHALIVGRVRDGMAEKEGEYERV